MSFFKKQVKVLFIGHALCYNYAAITERQVLIMDNYSAIMKMTREELNAFLDDVYCTGLNNGMYAKEHPEDDYVLLDTTPFDEKWLAEEAEPATLGVRGKDGDFMLSNAFVESVLRGTGITPDDLKDITSDDDTDDSDDAEDADDLDEFDDLIDSCEPDDGGESDGGRHSGGCRRAFPGH